MTINTLNQNNVFKSFSDFSCNNANGKINYNVQNSKQVTQDKNSDSSTLATVNVSDVAPKKGRKILAYTVATSVFTAGIGALFLAKGFSSANYKHINEFIDKLNSSIYKSLKSDKSRSIIGGINIAIVKALKTLLTGFKSTSNFNAIKDSLADKVLMSNKYTKKFANGVTEWFKGYSYDAVDKLYDRTGNSTRYFQADIINLIEEMRKTGNALDDLVDIKGESKTLREWLEKLEEYSVKLIDDYERGFSPQARNKRKILRESYLNGEGSIGLHKIDKGLNELVRETLFKDKGGIFHPIKNIKTFINYVTEELSLQGKEHLKRDIVKARKTFSNNITSNYNSASGTLRSLLSFVKPADKNVAKYVMEISEKLKIYNELSGTNEIIDRKKVYKEILDILSNIKSSMRNNNAYSSKDLAAVEEHINTLKITLVSNKGDLEHIKGIITGLSKYESVKKSDSILSLDKAREIDQAAEKITKLITKASDMESVDLFDKCAEFKVGSAPNDLLGIIFPVGVGAYAISKAKDKNDKVEATLTTAIPLVGGIGMMFIGAAKMFSGVKNLLISAGVGVLLNIIGNYCSKLYVAYQEKQSFADMAVEAYKNSIIYQQQELQKK